MKKIPTLFKREFENGKIIGITDEVAPELMDAYQNGIATVKYDGSCCAIIDGELYKRYDAKKGKKPPEGAIPCQEEPDPVTGHWPHWVKCDRDNPADKWFFKAAEDCEIITEYAYEGCGDWDTVPLENAPDGTYEAVGEHFNGNPYKVSGDWLVLHGRLRISNLKRDFDSIRRWLYSHETEGIVFWCHGEPVCKIKRTDFGFEWPIKKDGDIHWG